MKTEHRRILDLIEQQLESAPTLRFGQALFNMGINEFVDKKNPEKANHQLRDIYADDDEAILNRITFFPKL